MLVHTSPKTMGASVYALRSSSAHLASIKAIPVSVSGYDITDNRVKRWCQ